jgi:hypothetical protein
MIVGIILVAGSIYYVISGAWPALLTVLKGAVPIIVFVVGIFIVWLELDELRVEKELIKEEKKPRKKK